MVTVETREIPATGELCQNSGMDPEFCTPGDFARRMTKMNMEMTDRQALRLFAERGFPRFFLGKKSYVKFADGLGYVIARNRRH